MSYIREKWMQRSAGPEALKFYVHLSDEAIARWKASPLCAWIEGRAYVAPSSRCSACGHSLHLNAKCSAIFNAKNCECGR